MSPQIVGVQIYLIISKNRNIEFCELVNCYQGCKANCELSYLDLFHYSGDPYLSQSHYFESKFLEMTGFLN